MAKRIFTLFLIFVLSFSFSGFSDASSINRFIFTGKQHDERTGLIYFGARYYDPQTGRFITQDSYLGDRAIPSSLHRHLYAYSNPTTHIDPDGHVVLGGAAVAALVFGTAAVYDYVVSGRRGRVANQMGVKSNAGHLASNSIALTQSFSNSLTLGYFDASMQPGGEGTAEYLKQRSGYRDYRNAYNEITSKNPSYGLAALYALKGAGETANTALLSYAAKGLTSRPSSVVTESAALAEEAVILEEMIALESRQAIVRARQAATPTSNYSNSYLPANARPSPQRSSTSGAFITTESSSSSNPLGLTPIESYSNNQFNNSSTNLAGASDNFFIPTRPRLMTRIPNRLSPSQMQALQKSQGVEFGQIYITGPGKNGGGGQYWLIRGVEDKVAIPINSNVRWISHSHPTKLPNGKIAAIKASSKDRETMRKLQEAGSPQRTSQIVPENAEPIYWKE